MSEKFCGEGFPAWAAQPSGSLAFPEPAGFAFTNDAKSGCLPRSAPRAFTDMLRS